MGSFNDKVAAFNKLADRTKTWEELAMEWIAEIDIWLKQPTYDESREESYASAVKLIKNIKFNMEKMLDG